MQDHNVQSDIEPQNRATVPQSGMVKWVEPTGVERPETDTPDYSSHFRNQSEYFDQLQQAVSGLSALISSEMEAAEILKRAMEEVKKIEAETYDVVREFLGEKVTDQMQQINSDLDELAALVSGIEASLAGFSPVIDSEEEASKEEQAA